MANYQTRLRNNHGAWLQALLNDQAEDIGSSRGDLEEFVRLSTRQPRALIALGTPGPARGYALMLVDPLGDRGDVIARVHILEHTTDEAVHALFLQMRTQARRLAGKNVDDDVTIAIDQTALADHVAEAIRTLGGSQGLTLGEDDHEPTEDSETGQEEQTEAEAASEGDRDDPEVKEFFEERGVEVDEQVALEELKAAMPSEGEEVDEENPYECMDCERTFATPQALGSHSRTHS